MFLFCSWSCDSIVAVLPFVNVTYFSTIGPTAKEKAKKQGLKLKLKVNKIFGAHTINNNNNNVDLYSAFNAQGASQK